MMRFAILAASKISPKDPKVRAAAIRGMSKAVDDEGEGRKQEELAVRLHCGHCMQAVGLKLVLPWSGRGLFTGIFEMDRCVVNIFSVDLVLGTTVAPVRVQYSILLIGSNVKLKGLSSPHPLVC
jgi:hypothetical protein